MNREIYQEKLDKIYEKKEKHDNKTKNKIKNVLISAGEELGDYFLSKDYIKYNNCYYDPKTLIGIQIEIPENIFLDSTYNILAISIILKADDKILKIYELSQIYFRFKSEDPKQVYRRFMTLNGPKTSKKTFQYFCERYPDEMLKIIRRNKIKNINKKGDF